MSSKLALPDICCNDQIALPRVFAEFNPLKVSACSVHCTVVPPAISAASLPYLDYFLWLTLLFLRLLRVLQVCLYIDVIGMASLFHWALQPPISICGNIIYRATAWIHIISLWPRKGYFSGCVIPSKHVSAFPLRSRRPGCNIFQGMCSSTSVGPILSSFVWSFERSYDGSRRDYIIDLLMRHHIL